MFKQETGLTKLTCRHCGLECEVNLDLNARKSSNRTVSLFKSMWGEKAQIEPFHYLNQCGAIGVKVAVY